MIIEVLVDVRPPLLVHDLALLFQDVLDELSKLLRGVSEDLLGAIEFSRRQIRIFHHRYRSPSSDSVAETSSFVSFPWDASTTKGGNGHIPGALSANCAARSVIQP